MACSTDNPKTREEARARGYRVREISPSAEAQERYSLAEYPCPHCTKEGLPYLVDNGAEFYWEHHGNHSPRSGCSRFGENLRCGGKVRAGTATSLFKKTMRDYPARTEEEYLAAQHKVEEQGTDDTWERIVYLK